MGTFADKIKKITTPDGSLRERLWGGMQVVGGALTRSKSMMSAGVANASQTENRTIKQPEDDAVYTQDEITSQTETNKRQGYHSDEMGNIAGKMTHKEYTDMFGMNTNYTEPGFQFADEVEPEPKPEPEPEPEPIVVDNDVFTRGIAYNESRGSEDPYRAIGPTNDLGKYQASPKTLAAWSKAWLGRVYTPEEFLDDPQAQEKFFNEFKKVKDRYNVSDEDAAIMWHRGWGVLGYDQSFEEKKKALTEYLDRVRPEEISQNYLKSFREGIK